MARAQPDSTTLQRDDAARTILRAFASAAAKHRTLKRKDADQTPYLNHLVAVAYALTEVGASDHPTLIAPVQSHA